MVAEKEGARETLGEEEELMCRFQSSREQGQVSSFLVLAVTATPAKPCADITGKWTGC